jgi:hypothetical protein
MAATARITGVMNRPEANGDYLIEVSMPDGTIATALISLDVARAMVVILQQAIAEEAVGRARGTFLAVRVGSASIVHKGPTAELMVGSNELGQTVLETSDECLVELRRVIDLVLASRQSSKTVQ